MAKKKAARFDYNAAVRRLKSDGPQRLYLLYGPEDYLRERYLDTLRQLCVGDESAFSFRRLDGPAIDLGALEEAVNAVPFLTERSMVELRDAELDTLRDAPAERLKRILSDIPDYCTVAIICSPGKDPDGRLGLTRFLKKQGVALEFTEQEGGALINWVVSRFRAAEKEISRAEAEYLLFLCGSRMNALIPEIQKVAGYAAGPAVTRDDIDATVDRVPEADVFEMIDALSRRSADTAASLLSQLLADKGNHPIAINALIANQMRRLYAVKLGTAAGRSRADLLELCGTTYDFVLDKLLSSARAFSEAQLAMAIDLCAEYDYRMKSTGLDAELLLRELFARLAAGV